VAVEAGEEDAEGQHHEQGPDQQHGAELVLGGDHLPDHPAVGLDRVELQHFVDHEGEGGLDQDRHEELSERGPPVGTAVSTCHLKPPFRFFRPWPR